MLSVSWIKIVTLASMATCYYNIVVQGSSGQAVASQPEGSLVPTWLNVPLEPGWLFLLPKHAGLLN